MRTILFDRFGEPAEVLHCGELPRPDPGPGEVLVRTLAAPINPSDLLNIRGQYARSPKLPATPGFEGVGIVEAAGQGLYGKLLVGRRVAVLNSRSGSWGEFAVVNARQAIPLSKRLPLEQAAMFFVNPATAYILARQLLAVPQDEWLLQTAAGSSLGRMVIRLGRQFGFRTLNVVRRTEQVAELKELGGDVVIAASSENLRDQVFSATQGAGVHFAIDPVGGRVASAVARCLATGGRLVCYGTLSGEPLSISPRELIASGAVIEGFWLGHWMERLSLFSKLRLVRTLTNLILDGVLVSEVSQTFPLDRIVDAVTKAEQAGRGGKVLLSIGSA